MRVLIACEESQAVCIEFRKLGHEAYSCDLQPCSGGHPEWHIQTDVKNILKRPWETVGQVYMQNGDRKFILSWDRVISHPVCTRLANSGVMWLEKRNLWAELSEATRFFKVFQDYGKKGGVIAIENPIPHRYAVEEIGKYTQIIQPYMFGHPEQKATCLWLYGLPNLRETSNVYTEMKALPKAEQQRIHYLSPGPERAKLRSKTFSGIAKAMAEQWGGDINFNELD